MRIAIVHDYLDNMGGGEKLALLLARELGADFITTQLDIKIPKLFGIRVPRIIALGSLPKFAPFKQIYASWLFSRYDYSSYDVVIFSGNWAVFGSSKKKNAIWYCHTPCREFFDLRRSLAHSLPLLVRPLFFVWVAMHRHFYLKSVQRVNKIVTNSQFTKAKIKRFLGRPAEVVYPPIEQMSYRNGNDFHWLSVSRIYPAKNIHLLIEVFRELPEEQLVIIGDVAPGDHSHRYYRKLLRKLPSNVTILRRVPHRELSRFFADAKGYISLARDEDFGMNIAEALSARLPVVCTNSGGHREMVVDGKNGFLVPLRKDAVIRAVADISRLRKRGNLHDFSIDSFSDAMKRVIR